LRDEHTSSIATLGVPLKYDVTVPLRSMSDFVSDARAAVSAFDPEAEVIVFGHAADGNLHVNVIGANLEDHRGFDAAVLGAVSRFGGSISAEHGIGVAKREWLRLSRSADEIAVMRAIKRALDPDGVLNPNVLLPADGSN
jgi:FAD/FMN-containing dehydrogenase